MFRLTGIWMCLLLVTLEARAQSPFSIEECFLASFGDSAWSPCWDYALSQQDGAMLEALSLRSNRLHADSLIGHQIASPRLLQIALAAQAYLAELPGQDTGFWLKERCITAGYYRSILGDSLWPILENYWNYAPYTMHLFWVEGYVESKIRWFGAANPDLEQLIAWYNHTDEVLTNRILLDGSQKERIRYLQALMVSSLKGLVPSCEEITERYAIPLDRNLISLPDYTLIYTVLRINQCPDTPFLDSVITRTSRFVPTGYHCRLGAEYLAGKTRIQPAIYLLETAQSTESNSLVRSYDLLALANLYAMRKEFRTSAIYARRAAMAAPEWGQPYLFMADLVLRSAPFCDMEEFERKALYWLAIDHCNAARAIDPRVETSAVARINEYVRKMPSGAETRFYGLQLGDSFPIGCWMNTTTRVRIED